MTRTTRSYLKKLFRGATVAINVVVLFIWSFWATAVLTDGPIVDPGDQDQLQYACVTAGVVILGHLLASMMSKASMARYYTVLTANILAAPLFMTMVVMNGGIADIFNYLVVGIPFLILGFATPYISFLVLEE